MPELEQEPQQATPEQTRQDDVPTAVVEQEPVVAGGEPQPPAPPVVAPEPELDRPRDAIFLSRYADASMLGSRDDSTATARGGPRND